MEKVKTPAIDKPDIPVSNSKELDFVQERKPDKFDKLAEAINSGNVKPDLLRSIFI